MEPFIILPDSEIEVLLTEIDHIKDSKKRKWHGQIKLANSQIIRVRYEKSQFYGFDTWFICDTKGINFINRPGNHVPVSKMRMLSLSQSVILEERISQEEFNKTLHNVTNDVDFLTGMGQLRCQSSTGNHRGRNHTIRIPTQSGEPCRG